MFKQSLHRIYLYISSNNLDLNITQCQCSIFFFYTESANVFYDLGTHYATHMY
jgi:hypothetical protein